MTRSGFYADYQALLQHACLCTETNMVTRARDLQAFAFFGHRVSSTTQRRAAIIGFAGPKGCGKSTVAEVLRTSLIPACITAYRYRFAGPIKDMARALGLTAEQFDGAEKETPCDLLGGCTPRYVMQTLGTQWGRDTISPDLWVNATMARVDAEPHAIAIIDDVREAMAANTPSPIAYGEWHLPYFNPARDVDVAPADRVKVCVARCARVSYLTHEGIRDPSKDIALADSLLANGHMAPLEHVARPLAINESYPVTNDPNTGPRTFVGNFRGWVATFPLAMAGIRAVFPERSARSFSFLYVANVLGASAGALASAFVLVELLGFRRTQLVAAAVNTAIAIMAWAMARSIRPPEMLRVPSEREGSHALPATRERPRHALVLLLTTGLTSLGMEVVWARSFVPFQGTVVYAFASTIAVYLLATVDGSWVYRRAAGGLERAPSRSLPVSLALAAAALAALLPLAAADPVHSSTRRAACSRSCRRWARAATRSRSRRRGLRAVARPARRSGRVDRPGDRQHA